MAFDLRMLMLGFSFPVECPGTQGVEYHMPCERVAVACKLSARAACVTVSRCSGLGLVGILKLSY